MPFKGWFVFWLCCLTFSGLQSPLLAGIDPIRGKLTERRKAMDVEMYWLYLWPNLDQQTLKAKVYTIFKAVKPADTLQLDLLNIWAVDTVRFDGKSVSYKRKGNLILVPSAGLLMETDRKKSHHIAVSYHGKPLVSKRPPWTAGFVWAKDSLGRPWVGVSCEGEGASTWWPCKDHPSDEPEYGVQVTCTYPSELTFVSNGKLFSDSRNGLTRTTTWMVSSPINLYNVTLNLGHYAHWEDKYLGEKGLLNLDYYVLDYNRTKSKIHLKGQTKQMLKAFEASFGPYPYYQDGYKLVETPYWGMEHQSCIAYGNQYKNNKFGFDFILVHESGHEWWGNQLSTADHADLWIHEAFCTYAELVYLEQFGSDASIEDYPKVWKSRITNKTPIIGKREVAFNDWPDADQYYKGASAIYGFKQFLNNDTLFFFALRQFAQLSTKPISGPTAIDYWVSVANPQTTTPIGIDQQSARIWWEHLLTKTTLPSITITTTKSGSLLARFSNMPKPFRVLVPFAKQDGTLVKAYIGTEDTDISKLGEIQLEDLPIDLIKEN